MANEVFIPCHVLFERGIKWSFFSLEIAVLAY